MQRTFVLALVLVLAMTAQVYAAPGAFQRVPGVGAMTGMALLNSFTSLLDFGMKNTGDPINLLAFSFVSDKNDLTATYGAGMLGFDKVSKLWSTGANKVPVFFSNRTWTEPRPADYPPGDLWIPTPSPFDPKKVDQAKVVLNCAAKTLTITIGGASQVVPLTYEAGHFVGKTAAHVSYVFSVKQTQQSIPH